MTTEVRYRHYYCFWSEFPGPAPDRGHVVSVNGAIWQIIDTPMIVSNRRMHLVLKPYDIYMVPFGAPIRELPNVNRREDEPEPTQPLPTSIYQQMQP